MTMDMICLFQQNLQKMNNTLNIFDASVISQTATEHEMTRDELVEELRPKLEDILKSRFSGNSQKQQIIN